jgi:hypothetical protein
VIDIEEPDSQDGIPRDCVPNDDGSRGGIHVAIVVPTLFPSGRLLTTPGAEAALQEAKVSLIDLLARHLRGDWGDLSEDDRKTNDEALASGEDRIFSAYTLPTTDQKVWIITEWDRSITTALCPTNIDTSAYLRTFWKCADDDRKEEDDGRFRNRSDGPDRRAIHRPRHGGRHSPTPRSRTG